MRPLAALFPAALLALGACAGSATAGRKPDHPLAVVYAEYSVPVALGRALPGKVGGWDEGVTLKGWVQGWTHRPRADRDDMFVNFVLHYPPGLSAASPWMTARNRVDSPAPCRYIELMGKVLMSDILALSVSERIRLTQEIWDSIAALPDSIPLSQADREELDRRLAAYHADPRAGAPWAEVRERLLRRK